MIEIGAKEIKIIHEPADDDSGFQAADKILAGAARIVFLGFGYAEANVQRLQLDLKAKKEFRGSVMGLRRAELMTPSSRF